MEAIETQSVVITETNPETEEETKTETTGEAKTETKIERKVETKTSSNVADMFPLEDEINLIDDNLYLSGYRPAARADPNEIKTVLSIIQMPFHEEDKKEGIEYLQLTANDLDSTDLLTYFPQTNKWIGDRVSSGRPVLVHCMAGISRSATIVCAYMMQKYKLGAEEAIDRVREKRRYIMPNLGFVRQLELFHQMDYTLNANERNLRNFLVDIYLVVDYTNRAIGNYFERLAVAEELTKDVELGREYCCANCSRVAFHEINVIHNTSLMNGPRCQDIYIDPPEWIGDSLKEMCPFAPYGRMREVQLIKKGMLPEANRFVKKCAQCEKPLFSYHRFLTPHPLECHCSLHLGLNSYVKIKVIPGSVKVSDPHKEGSILAEDVNNKLNLENRGEDKASSITSRLIPDFLGHLVWKVSPKKSAEVSSDSANE